MKNRRVIAIWITLALLVTLYWCCRPGVFSYVNYWRISPGMILPQVERLIGKPGKEISPREVPGTPTGPLVSGDRFFRWEDGNRVIFISLKSGVVYEKYYWEPSF
jgi:hypothetical protein